MACKVTARRFFPNFLNLDATFNQSEDWKADDPQRYIHEVATMGCRTRVFENRFGPKTSIGRGNLSFSTINIVRLAIECMQVENKEERIALFFAKLDHMLELTARQLHERMEFQKTAYAKQFPLLMSSLWLGSEKLKPNDSIASVINKAPWVSALSDWPNVWWPLPVSIMAKMRIRKLRHKDRYVYPGSCQPIL